MPEERFYPDGIRQLNTSPATPTVRLWWRDCIFAAR